jgi:hypothetical protein
MRETKNAEPGKWKFVAPLGLVLLGAVGALCFARHNAEKFDIKSIQFNESDCKNLISGMRDLQNKDIHNYRYNNELHTELYKFDIEKLKELNSIYEKNCAGRKIKVEKPKPVIETKPEQIPETVCGRMEKILLTNAIDTEFSLSSEPDSHFYTAQTYAVLYMNGCPENKEKFRDIASRELEIFSALASEGEYSTNEKTKKINKIRGMLGLDGAKQEQILKTTCGRIESLIYIPTNYINSEDFYNHLGLAQRYVRLFQFGCAQNKETHRAMAEQELEIYKGLGGDTENQDFIQARNMLDDKPAARQLCEDKSEPDKNGCCAGETPTVMQDGLKACCPQTGGDCFPAME